MKSKGTKSFQKLKTSSGKQFTKLFQSVQYMKASKTEDSKEPLELKELKEPAEISEGQA